MTRKRPLTQPQVDALQHNGIHSVGPTGLYLQIKPNGARSWLFRYTVQGKARWHGLGAVREVSLKDARERVEELRVDIRREGRDPVAEARVVRQRALPTPSAPTFDWCAEQFIAAHETGWKNDKHRAQWTSTLKNYASPKIGSEPVDRVGVEEVVSVLKPVWHKLPETASRVRGRIEQVLGWATAMGHRAGENPARWKGGPLEHLLPPIGRIRKVEKRAAVPVPEMPALWKRLEGLGSTSSRALRFTILTAARTGETIGGTWDEVDLEAKAWTIPAERMKAGVEHVVPLTDEAIALLGPAKRTGYLFPGARPKKPLSNMAMLEVVRGIRDDGATVHGMRAAFRTWAADAGHPREVAEACLAHAVGNAVEQAYQRSSYLTRRRAVLEDWAQYLAG